MHNVQRTMHNTDRKRNQYLGFSASFGLLCIMKKDILENEEKYKINLLVVFLSVITVFTKSQSLLVWLGNICGL